METSRIDTNIWEPLVQDEQLFVQVHVQWLSSKGQKKAKLVMSAIESYDIVDGGSTQTNVATAGEGPSKRIKSIHLVSLTLMKLQMDM